MKKQRKRENNMNIEALEKEILNAVSNAIKGCPMKDDFVEYTMEDAIDYMAKELWGKDFVEMWEEE